jgi:hypothetical protein
MLMRITWGKVRPGFWDEFEETFRRAAKQEMPGLIKRWMVRDTRDTNSMFIVTLWKDVESMDDPCTMNFINALGPLFLGEYSASVCEVVYES